MKALTVEEYAVLTWAKNTKFTPEASATKSQLIDVGLMSYKRSFYEGSLRVNIFGPTDHGDRAVRVHRAWLQSMGVAAS